MRAPLALVASVVVIAAPVGFSGADFNSTSGNPGNSLGTAPDYAAPDVAAAPIAKVQAGNGSSFIRQGGTYHVYANVTDSGNPASNTSAVTADVSAITTGQTAVALVAGSYTAAGVTYNYRSAQLTATSPLAAGDKSYRLTTTDGAGNTRTDATGRTVTVDNTPPAAADVQTANKAGGTAFRPEIGDTATLTFDEIVEPQSILATWSGAAAENVVVRINNNDAATGGNDSLRVYNLANSTQLPLGTVNLGRTDYVGANRTYGASGTRSTMAVTGNGFLVVLGTASGAGTTAAANGTMTWTPASAAYDRAANPAATTARTELGTADREF